MKEEGRRRQDSIRREARLLVEIQKRAETYWPGWIFTIEELVGECTFTKETVQKDIHLLVKAGKLKRGANRKCLCGKTSFTYMLP